MQRLRWVQSIFLRRLTRAEGTDVEVLIPISCLHARLESVDWIQRPF